MKRAIKIIAAMAIILTVALSMCSCASDDKVVCVYNWGDYIDKETIAAFEKETGYKVKYMTFDTNEFMYTKLANGNANYDVIIPSDYMINRLIEEGRLEKINFDNVPNLKNVDLADQVKNEDFDYDPTGEYSVPYMWGTMGILYNKTMVDETVDSWEMLWNEKYKDSIIMYNSSRDSIGITLKMLGYSMNSVNEAELEEAKQKLIEQTDLVYAYGVDDIKDKMIGGEAALALVWAGDAVYCMSVNSDLEYVIPKEGSNIFCDAMCIPKGCNNKEGAEAFINFMCKPEISFRNAKYIGYSTPISAARELMGEDGNNPAAYPENLDELDLEFFIHLGDKTKLYGNLWAEVMDSN